MKMTYKTIFSDSIEESQRRLAIIVDQIDKNTDGFVTLDEMRDWIRFSQVSCSKRDSNPELANFFSSTSQTRSYFYAGLIDGAARIFPTSYAATGNCAHACTVEPLLRGLNPGRFSD